MTFVGAELSAESVLNRGATQARKVGPSLSFGDARHLELSRWLVEEAYTLDDQRYEDWLATIADDVHYLMPVRVTTALGAGYTTSPGMAHWDENKYSLSRRVARFLTEHAWTEDPPSRLRHYVTNVRTFETDVEGELIVDSAVLLFRSRSDTNPASILSAQREDVLRCTEDGYVLARRVIMIDESVLRTQNLAIFL
ncbi:MULTISPECIES: 3-phenylpropionate/cinnamic acid dioxygenase subunit beta [Microbacterium]|uniref:3-phenylpropionate/cinnamic acid dioxygenase subunit beta n=1 Tax=Microbacterium TaxID=33882 RepID=UPI00070096E4|nr:MULTISPECIES: 3-phenylpropionate/cinnamic acid dioxygenase subunit beta [unclassified Microbacterium]KQZ05210.1 3-phenylpropionate dioxygenase [Microbacterium sp. Root53]MCD1268483.1 3-phenylpropionate/cinnamic acid dioxygenase subunit beta [Microbacterium sp. MEC084]